MFIVLRSENRKSDYSHGELQTTKSTYGSGAHSMQIQHCLTALADQLRIVYAPDDEYDPGGHSVQEEDPVGRRDRSKKLIKHLNVSLLYDNQVILVQHREWRR